METKKKALHCVDVLIALVNFVRVQEFSIPFSGLMERYIPR